MSAASANILITATNLASGVLARIRGDIGSLEAAQNRFAASTERLQRALFQGIAAGFSLGLPIREAIIFENEISEIAKVADFKAPDGIKVFSADLKKLSETIALPREELSKIAAAGGELGIAGEDLTRFTETTGKVAVAFGIAGDDAARQLSSIKTLYKQTDAQLQDTADTINYLSNTSRASAREILDLQTRIAGTAGSLGISSQFSSALASTLIALGQSPEIGATALKDVFITLGGADRAVKKAREAFAELGLTGEGLKNAFNKDASGALFDFFEVLKKAPEADRLGLTADIFGVQNADKILALINNADLLRTTLDGINKVRADGKAAFSGSVETEFGRKMATTSAEITKARNAIKNTAAEIGDSLTPAVRDFLKAVQPTIDALGKWAQQNPETIKNIGLFGAALIGLKVATAVGSFGITMLSSAFSGFVSFVTRLPAVGRMIVSFGGLAISVLRAVSIALLTTPIGLAVTAIGAAFVGAGLLIYKYWQPIKAFFSGFFDGVMAGIQPLLDSFAPLAPIFSGIGEAVSGMFSLFGALLKPLGLTAAGFEKVSSVGMFMGQVVANAIRLVLAPIELLVRGLGFVYSGERKLTGIGGGESPSVSGASAGSGAFAPRSLAGAQMSPAPMQQVGGKLDIRIMSDGKPQISRIESQNQSFVIDAKAGAMQ